MNETQIGDQCAKLLPAKSNQFLVSHAFSSFVTFEKNLPLSRDQFYKKNCFCNMKLSNFQEGDMGC